MLTKHNACTVTPKIEEADDRHAYRSDVICTHSALYRSDENLET